LDVDRRSRQDDQDVAAPGLATKVEIVEHQGQSVTPGNAFEILGDGQGPPVFRQRTEVESDRHLAAQECSCFIQWGFEKLHLAWLVPNERERTAGRRANVGDARRVAIVPGVLDRRQE